MTLCFSAILGVAAMVLDVGSWYRADRALQAAVDAAALAGAQELPWDPDAAVVVALDYAERNGGGIEAEEIAVLDHRTIRVEAIRPTPGFFAKVFGMDTVDVGAGATARALYLARPQFVAPIAVDEDHPGLGCDPAPCGHDVEIPLAHLHSPGSGTAAGSFGLVDLAGGSGSVGASTLAEWLLDGWDGFLDIGWYDAVPSSKFSSVQVREALDARTGETLMFPVWRSIAGSGSNARFEVVGWVGFRLAGYTIHGSSGALHGRFTRVVWRGIQSESPPDGPDYGVRSIRLVD